MTTLNKHRRSIGTLRPHKKTKLRSPDMTGKLNLQKHTHEAFDKWFQETDQEELVCGTAAWVCVDAEGVRYFNVELTPPFTRPVTTPIAVVLDEMFGDEKRKK
jgi:hypothetical protein